MNWDEYFTQLLEPVAAKSKDRSRQVGCILVGEHHQLLSTGFNGMPRGCDDDAPERHERPEKYYWAEHAERNAIYNAARHGVSLDYAGAYISLFPCMDCARALVQSGVRFVCAPRPDLDDPQWGPHFRRALLLFDECSVRYEPAPDVWPEQYTIPLEALPK